jgi:hypothetical protein
MTAVVLACAMVSLTPAERDSILAETQGNEEFWQEMLAGSEGEVLEAVEYLLGSIPRLDRLEMTETALMDHVLGALDTRDVFYDDLPDTLFLQCLVQYRIDEEPVTPYRSRLSSFWASHLAPTDESVYGTAEGIAAWIDGNMTVGRYDYLGGVEDPVTVLESGGGTPRELRVLLCSSLKSIGIASRAVEGWFSGPDGGSRSWIEVWDGAEWLPLATRADSVPAGWEGLALAIVPTQEAIVTSDYVPTATLVTTPIYDALDDDWTAVLNIPAGGRFVPLDWAWLETTEPDTVELGPGPYTLMVSFRKPSGAVDMWLHDFEAVAGDTMLIELVGAEYALTPLPPGGTP